jgi:hypothetical protein
MSDPTTQIPAAADDPWAQFPDVDPSFLNGPSSTTLPPQATRRTLPQMPSNLAWPQNSAPVMPNYASPDPSGSRYGMFGRGPDGAMLPLFQIQPNFGPANLNLGNVQIRPPTPPWAFTDDRGNNVGVVGTDAWATVRSNNNGAAWRNNDPGNMRPDKFTRKWSQVGANTNCPTCGRSGFAIMPDEQAGENAMIDKLTNSDVYAGPNVDQVIASWVRGPNNTSKPDAELRAYMRDIHSFTGWPRGFQYDQKNPQMVRLLANAIKRREGWIQGEANFYDARLPDAASSDSP